MKESGKAVVFDGHHGMTLAHDCIHDVLLALGDSGRYEDVACSCCSKAASFLDFESGSIFSMTDNGQKRIVQQLDVAIAVTSDGAAIGKHSLLEPLPDSFIELIRATLALKIAFEGWQREGSGNGSSLGVEPSGIVIAHKAIARVVTDIFALPL